VTPHAPEPPDPDADWVRLTRWILFAVLFGLAVIATLQLGFGVRIP
jgi:hypothetical protein